MRRKNDKRILIIMALNGVMFALNAYYLAAFQIVVNRVKEVVAVLRSEQAVRSPRLWREGLEQ